MVYDPAGGNTVKNSDNVIVGENEKPILQYIIKEAFPAQIYDIPFNWADNQNTKFQINFEYFDWIEYHEILEQNATSPDNPNTTIPPQNPNIRRGGSIFNPREPVPPISNPTGDYNPGAGPNPITGR